MSVQPDDGPRDGGGTVRPAGEGLDDAEMVRQVASQTSPDLAAEDVFAREADGASSDAEIADTDADRLAD